MLRWIWIAPLLLTACQPYRSSFDCQPGRGVPCTSVTTIEKMIVETPEETPDIFLEYLASPCVDKPCNESCLLRRVWIEGKELPSGLFVEGHYIYLKSRAEP